MPAGTRIPAAASSTVTSVSEPFSTGTRTATPASRPARSVGTSPIAAGSSQSALAYAFAAAARSGRPLVVLRCVPAKRAAHAGQALALNAFRELYSQVDVTEEVAVGP